MNNILDLKEEMDYIYKNIYRALGVPSEYFIEDSFTIELAEIYKNITLESKKYMNLKIRRYEGEEFKKSLVDVLRGSNMPFKYIIKNIFLKGEDGSKVSVNLGEWLKFEGIFHWVGYEVNFYDGISEIVDLELGKEDYIFNESNYLLIKNLEDIFMYMGDSIPEVGKKKEEKYERYLDF